MSVAPFDRAAVRRQRRRAAPGFAAHDFLYREVAGRLAERLGEVRREFARGLELGCRGDAFTRAATAQGCKAGFVVAGPLAEALPGVARVVADEERLPFAPGSFDLIVSVLALHWVNDLPGALAQIRAALAPDGLFLAALFGGTTLHELRAALAEGEVAATGGASPRVAPMVDVADAGRLLQRAGFALPMADVDSLAVTYADAFALMRELRGMGEANALAARRRRFTGRQTMLAAAAAYARRFSDPDGRIRATFQVVYLTGWAPAPSQPRPLAPGSAQARLAEALGTRERPAGDPTRR